MFVDNGTRIDYYKSEGSNYRDTIVFTDMLAHGIFMQGYIPLLVRGDYVYFGNEDDGHIWFDLTECYCIRRSHLLSLVYNLVQLAEYDS